jgi:precorrin-2 dehydrogenase/sirohydrochlorin ferrochelatase
MEKTNLLYPIFLRLDRVSILLVGGGNVALEKLTYILKSSPNAKIIAVAKDFLPEIYDFQSKFDVQLYQKEWQESDLNGVQLVIATTNDPTLNELIYEAAHQRNLLVNVADKPYLCDFYLGAIVTKGQLKLAFSSNGQSPTLVKRLKEFFEEILPNDLAILITHLTYYRSQIKGNLSEKVKKLNELTKMFQNNN